MEDVQIPEENILPNVAGLKVGTIDSDTIHSLASLGTIWVSK